MADKIARNTQYAYSATASLVLQSKDRVDRSHEHTGEAESLWGKMSGRMGDRVSYARPRELEERLEKMRNRVLQDREDDGVLRKGHEKRSVLSTAIGEKYYTPKTRDTRMAYEKLLHAIQACVGDQPTEMLRGFAEESLALLKDEHLTQPQKKARIGQLLNARDEETFTSLCAIGRDITDYVEEASMEATEDDDDRAIAVVFPDAEGEDEDQYEIGRSESEDEGDGDEAVGEATSMSVLTALEEDGDADGMDVEDTAIRARDIDAFWLQRKIAEFESDAHTALQQSNEVLHVLEADTDDRECENYLVGLLGFERFGLVKDLLMNRLKIVYCTRLAKAKGDDVAAIEEEMQRNPRAAAVLDELRGKNTQTSAEALERSIRLEARRLKTAKKREEEEEGLRALSRMEGQAAAEFASARKAIDLEDLAFAQGSHFMSNKTLKFPKGSQRVPKKGYEEIHIPAVKKAALQSGEREKVPVSELPEWARAAFVRRGKDGLEPIRSLNRIQSAVHKAALYSSENMLICAPTGAGKTNCALLTMLHTIGCFRDDNGKIDLDSFKIVYVAPMKSLVREMVGNFSLKLGQLGVTVKELSGDVNLTKQQISETQVIVTTPEKWDIVTRKSGDRAYTQLVRLILFDEIHLLHDDRGPVIESIVARTLRQIESTQELVRLVGLSATLPNYEDVATFLRVKEENLFAFDNSYRPVPLEQQYIGLTVKKAMKQYQLMNEITYEKVIEHAGKDQVLVFVHSRKETAKTARAIRDMALENDTLGRFLSAEEGARGILSAEAENAKDPALRELLPYGFAVHHAGMSRADRTLVEDLFLDGVIQVMCSTATLAWGVNLPAHTVIIKGTKIYNPEKGAWVELSPLDVMQMFGRAGRPQHDTQGEGILITTHQELQFYGSLMNNQLPIESQFIAKLADNLNAEIVMGTIQDSKEAIDWLGYTYLYICMLRSPTLYGVTYDDYENDKSLEQRRADLVHSAATVLDKNNLIKYDRKSGGFQVTNLGRVAAHYYISHSSIATYNEHLKQSLSDIDLFRLFALSSEFKYIGVRQEEKLELEKLLDKVPVPVKEGVEEPTAKINVLLQAYISRLKLDGFALVADMVYVTQSAARIMRALFEIVLKRKWAQLASRTLTLCKMIANRMWPSQCLLRQFRSIPEAIIAKLEKKEMDFDRLYDLNSQQLGDLISFPSQGKMLHRHIHQFPRLELSAQVQPITRSMLKIDLTITADFNFVEKHHGNAEAFWVWVEDVDGETILHHEYFLLKGKYAEDDHYLTFTVPLFEPMPPQYFIRVVSDKWLGSEAVLPVSFSYLILPEKYPPHTDLLDLQPTLLAELKNPAFQSLYEDEFKRFNPIQTQAFPALYGTDDNILIGAPTGSGKTVCAELAVMRMFSNPPKEGKARCVYIAPMEELATERYIDWTIKFEQRLGKRVVRLTGETAVDLKLLEAGEIIISEPDQWDTLSRRWRNRKNVHSISLFVVDELHLIGGDCGPAIEVITSRMRYIASQTGKPIRIIGLSTSLANARDLADWMGVSSRNLFNFHPNVRPVPLEIRLQGFEQAHFENRMLAMMKPCIQALTHGAEGKPAIVFVPSRKQVIRVAHQLRQYCDSSLDPAQFLGLGKEELEQHTEGIRNKFLRELLSYGIAIYHEHLSVEDKLTVKRLFDAEAIQVVIVVRKLCWGLALSSYLTVIMGTEYYDGKNHRYADYPITDLLQMMGRASRPLHDPSAKCVILCHGPKKEYYRKFLFEPLPVESHLDLYLANHFNAEIVTKTIENKQDCVDYLTWTFFYRRLTQNPIYYNLQGISHRHVSDHLSELVEFTIQTLADCGTIAVEDETDLSALNLGMIASHYNINHTTAELFSSSLTEKTKLKGLLEIISAASEYDSLEIGRGESAVLQRLAGHLPVKISSARFDDAHSKANVLLQCHFSRTRLSQELFSDQQVVLTKALRLVRALVDVISSSGWLSPALAAMELSQMIVQARWSFDPFLQQVPHFGSEILERCAKNKVESVFDLMELDGKERNALLQLSKPDMKDVAVYCNRYPNVDVDFVVEDEDSISSGSAVNMVVEMERDADEAVGAVIAPRCPVEKVEEWWIVLGDEQANTLLAIKRVALGRTARIKMPFVAPEQGEHNLTLFFMCDSYAGCDQELPVKIKVGEAESDEEEGESDEDEMQVEK